jgi:phenylacetate-CoA ligase
MNMMSAYNLAPVWLQNIICSAKGFQIQRTRYNSEFKKMLVEFEERDRWTYSQLCDFRDEKLRAIIQHSYETVQYYKDLFDSLGMVPDDIKTIEDLKYLPLLNKAIVNANPKKFISSKAKDYKLVHTHTSGSTGSSFRFITTMESIHAQWAVFWRQRRKLGIDLGTWMAQFGSRVVVPTKQKNPPYWRTDFPSRRVYFSAFHENQENMLYYYQIIKKKQLPWIHGFPSLLMPLAKYMSENGLSFDHVKWVTTGAENLLKHQGTAMKNAFGIEPLEVYGQAENVAIFSQQKDKNIFVDEDFSAVEFVPNEYGMYEVIGTNLWNYAMPLIRWQTGDIVTIDKNLYDDRRRVLSIDGRKDDYVTLPNGIKVGRLSSVFMDTTSIREAQIYQKGDYSVVVYVVGDPTACTEDEKISRKLMENYFGGQLPITFKYVDKIPRTRGGKLQFVISEIK